MTDYVEACISDSLKTLRDACDTAEREAARKGNDIEAISRIIHAMAWGHANATTPLIAALNTIVRKQEMAK